MTRNEASRLFATGRLRTAGDRAEVAWMVGQVEPVGQVGRRRTTSDESRGQAKIHHEGHVRGGTRFA